MKRYSLTQITHFQVQDDGTMLVTNKSETLEEINDDVQTFKCKHQLNVSEKRYGILTLGSKDKLGFSIPADTDINVVYDGNSYIAHSHKSVHGRLDRLSKLICNHFNVNEWVTIEYDSRQLQLSIYKGVEE